VVVDTVRGSSQLRHTAERTQWYRRRNVGAGFGIEALTGFYIRNLCGLGLKFRVYNVHRILTRV